MDAPVWETSKENVAVRKGGRDVKDLARKFGVVAGPAAGADDERARLEAALATDSDDPLAPWLAYVAWLERERPTDALAAFEVRERCARRFKDDAAYKNDERYVAVWLAYVDRLAKPDDAFKFIHKKKVGETRASFWAAWALHAESQGRFKSAAELYERGAAKDAAPAGVLAAKRAAFDARRERREAAASNQRPSPAGAGPQRDGPRGAARARPARGLGSRAGAAPAPPQVPQGGFAIFVGDARCRASTPTPATRTTGPTLARSRRVKENERGPTPWAEAALEAPKPKARRPSASASRRRRPRAAGARGAAGAHPRLGIPRLR
ncbi:hypothetical protein JL720_14466 [Aureococcus anophagefferens]|nr:hypothetical protein JL720_14466 [Aureococcus anophagefferens]